MIQAKSSGRALNRHDSRVEAPRFEQAHFANLARPRRATHLTSSAHPREGSRLGSRANRGRQSPGAVAQVLGWVAPASYSANHPSCGARATISLTAQRVTVRREVCLRRCGPDRSWGRSARRSTRPPRQALDHRMGSPSPAVAHLQDGLTQHLAALQEAHQRWPTFIAILDNARLVGPGHASGQGQTGRTGPLVDLRRRHGLAADLRYSIPRLGKGPDDHCHRRGFRFRRTCSNGAPARQWAKNCSTQPV